MEVISDVLNIEITAQQIWDHIQVKKEKKDDGPLLNQNKDHFVTIMSEFDTILGPSTMTILNLNNKPIILFGDIHEKTKTKNGVKLRDYLDYIFDHCPVTTDFFIETINFYDTFRKQPFGYEDDEMGNIFVRFKDCLNKTKKKCPYTPDKVRFHNIEYRRSHNQHYNMSEIRLKLVNIVSKSEESLDDFITGAVEYPNIMDALFEGDFEKMSKGFNIVFSPLNLKKYYTPKILRKNGLLGKLSKQYNGLECKDKVKKYFMGSIAKHTATLYNAHDFASKINSVEEFLFHFDILFMDAYAIGRLLKSIYICPKNFNILYAGDNHVGRYIRILQNILEGEKILRINNGLYNHTINIDLFDREIIGRELAKYF